ncbi:protein-glutamine gamma-glutamyltransferase [Paenibacillus sp. 1781tsa1]|uniref:protein-glutamine gamma-glutamyltransferase n=1 Tax=Paenibacillus sp. 1781tsa1 TaxID=2953810 RepID=UPI00209EBC9F|nr:protein-glutamine gamma-glutamyltransferase [Paenibacillus sp. 1781tsa1]MCP1183865.1 protein-glutamine gamma-glutamyltransferase [Paenibacillus sp. 1781tsa1]
MIIVANQPAQLNRSEWSDFEWYWLQQLQNRPTRYVYQSMDHLRFEWELRGSLVDAAEGLDRSGVSFASFEKSRCNPAYWNRNAEGGFELKSNVTPADGIRDIWRNGHLYAFECATATVIVLYGGVLGSIREDSFNSLFRNLLLFDWHYDSDLRLTEKNGSETALPGDVLYFKNPDVSPETPEWQGENTIMLRENWYYGHGIGIARGEEIIRTLNQFRVPGSRVSAYLMDMVIYPDFFYLSRFAKNSENNVAAGSTPVLPGQLYVRLGGSRYLRS